MTPDGRLTYCNAGHNPPLVLGKAGVRLLEAGGPVVGLLEFAPYDQETVQLEPGDTIIVFSDGVSEALDSDGEEFGDERLQDVALATRHEPAPALVDSLVSAVRDFTRGAPQSDDITAMVVRYLGPAASGRDA
jgi:sigma-B regulation protein RsbU (phosphoserine phosphatase)